MATEIKILDDEKIVHTGNYDFDEFYMHMWRWLEWHKFTTEEKKYAEKKKVGGEGVESKDLDIQWEGSKDYDEYTKINVKLRFVTFGMKDAEVQRGSAKVKMQTGEVDVFVSASFTLDKDNKYEKNPGLKFFRHFFERYLYKDTIEQLKSDTWKFGWDLHNEVKAFLNLYKHTR